LFESPNADEMTLVLHEWEPFATDGT
jgi:hypothetical protein